MLDLEKISVKTDNIIDELLNRQKIRLSLVRFDLLHSIVSGNKLFKIYFFLNEALQKNKKIITFGGAYSNHLSATAYACKILNISCKGTVRGENSANLSLTLKNCIEWGMELEFISRSEYSYIKYKDTETDNEIYIPEGGFHLKGKSGAALMYDYFKQEGGDFLCIPVGSATTLAGIISVSKIKNTIAFPAIKNMTDIPERLKKLKTDQATGLLINNEYHFGGFASSNEELKHFIKNFYFKHNIPLDIIYTGKMMYGIFDLIKKGYFSPNSHIIALHTGGLQGNPQDFFSTLK